MHSWRAQRIVVDMAALHQPGHDRGLGRYARRLREALADLPSDIEAVEYPGGRSSRHERIAELLAIPPRSVFVRQNGLYFHATTPYNCDPLHLATSCVTVHDLVPLDISAYRKSGLKAAFFHRLAARCASFAVPSEFTANRLRDLLSPASNNIVHAPLPVLLHGDIEECDGRCITKLCEDAVPYAVSMIDMLTVDPRKRFPWIVAAARYLRDHNVRTVVFGSGTENLSGDDGFIGLGRICDAHVRSVLAGGGCFLYASAYEGQGLPPQESLLMGTPVVAYANTSLPEMLGPGAIWLSESAQAWRDCIKASANDVEGKHLGEAALQLATSHTEAARIGELGRQYVASFTAQRFNHAISQLYRSLLDGTN